jgi:nucleotide-binding universal stress UspA family protein
MLKALVPVDGSEQSLSAVQHVIQRVQNQEAIDIHVVNVQPPFHGDVTAFVPKSNVQDFHREQGEAQLAAGCALLDAAGVRYTKHIFVGHAAKVIAHYAKELGCNEVVMGTHGHGTIAQLLLGSVSHEAIHQMDPHIAVTLVKNEHTQTPPVARGVAR